MGPTLYMRSVIDRNVMRSMFTCVLVVEHTRFINPTFDFETWNFQTFMSAFNGVQ
jgi:hypothetical protein